MTLDALAGVPPSPGRMNVDFEERVDFTRLRAYRLSRARAALDASELGAVLLFDINNIRYVSATMIGEWARDKVARYALLTRRGEPIVWDFGSAARHHQLYSPWIRPENSRAGMLGLRGAVAPDAGLIARAVAEIQSELAAAGVAGMPLGVDIAETPMLLELLRAGIDVRDAQQVMLDARLIKSPDEIALLSTAAAMVDGVYQDIAEALKPGVRENEIVALANKRLYEMGSDDVEAVNAVSGERCNPHPHNFSDRLIRPGDQAYFDIIQSFNGYRTCYYRTFAVGRSNSGATRRLYARSRVDRFRHRAGAPGNQHGSDRETVAGGEGLRVSERDGRVRAAVRPWTWSRPARAADHLAAQFPRPPHRAAGGDGLRARDVLPRDRWPVGGPNRGGSRGHPGRLLAADPLSGRGAVCHQQVLAGMRDDSRGEQSDDVNH